MSKILNGPSNNGQCLNFDHLTFWVSNAKQAASYYCIHFGFEPFVFRGLETGFRSLASHAVKQGNIILVFSSSLSPTTSTEISNHVSKHGDSVKDIAFSVDNIDFILKRAVDKGATLIQDIQEDIDSDDGIIRTTTVATFGDVTHTFVERKNYHGLFLPGFHPSPLKVKLIVVVDSNCLTMTAPFYVDSTIERATAYWSNPY